jgi:hypothetical protein
MSRKFVGRWWLRAVIPYSGEATQRPVSGIHSMEQDGTNTGVQFCGDDTGRMLDDDDRSESFLCDKARMMLAYRSDGPRLQTSPVDSE